MKYLKLLSLVFFSSFATGQQPTVVGDAFDVYGNELLYREFHYYSEDGLDHKIVYKSANHETIAVKEVDYRSGFNKPSFKQQGKWLKEFFQVSIKDDSLLMKYEAPNQKVLTKIVGIEAPLVVDAGFDYYIRENWQSLLARDKLTFYFPVPARQSLVNLQVKAMPCSYSNENHQCFQINSSSWLIRLLLDDIELGYDIDNKRLTRFKGLGNISDPSGSALIVDIRYRYDDLCSTSNCSQLLFGQLSLN